MRLAQCRTKILPRCVRTAPPSTSSGQVLQKGAISVSPFEKGGLGEISQQVLQYTNVIWFDLG